MQKQKGISTLVGIIIIIVAAIILFGGVFAYQYFVIQKNQPTNIIQPIDQTAGWKTFRSKQYGFEFRYPTTWKVDEDPFSPTLILGQVQNKDTVIPFGSISINQKPISSSSFIDPIFEKMYAANSQCPIAAGTYLGDVYCLTEQNIQINTGTWKEAVICSSSGSEFNPSFCLHQFWIDVKDSFYVVKFDFMGPMQGTGIKFLKPTTAGSGETILFDKFFKGFSFFPPTPGFIDIKANEE